jgi:hypothetical protein
MATAGGYEAKVSEIPNNPTPKKEWVYKWQPAFLRWLRTKGNVTAACDKAKIDRTWVYEVREQDADFAAAWDEALEEATERLEMEARRRAHDGVLEPVFHAGVKVGAIRKYSDTLLIFLLKAHAPAKYRDNSRIEHTGKDGGPIETKTNVSVEIARLTTEQIEQLIAIAESAQAQN